MTDEPITRYEFALLKDNLDARLEKIDSSLDKMWGKIDSVCKRPAWSVLAIISLLSSLVVGLTMLLLK